MSDLLPHENKADWSQILMPYVRMPPDDTPRNIMFGTVRPWTQGDLNNREWHQAIARLCEIVGNERGHAITLDILHNQAERDLARALPLIAVVIELELRGGADEPPLSIQEIIEAAKEIEAKYRK